ncbi:hypothetical protein D3C71_1997390 [compost metagenome]
MEFIGEIEKNLGKVAHKHFLPMQNGDVVKTWANISNMKKMLGYQPRISVAEGIRNFVSWYKDFYGIIESVPEQLEPVGYD